MAKKKKPTLKAPAGVNRGFATTSVPKKPPAPAPVSAPAAAAAGESTPARGPAKEPPPAACGSKGRDTPSVRTLYGFDEDDAEQQLLQDLVNQHWDKADKETAKLWKTLEFDRRQAAAYQSFDLDPEIRDELLDLVSYSYRVPEAEDKAAETDDDAPTSNGKSSGSPCPALGSAPGLSAQAAEFIPSQQLGPRTDEPADDAPSPSVHAPAPDWATLPPPPLKDATQPLDKALPRALVTRGLLLKLGFTPEQADMALRNATRFELDDCLSYLALRLSEEELDAAGKAADNPQTSQASTASAAEDDEEMVQDRSIPPSHPAYSFKRTVAKASEMKFVPPPPPVVEGDGDALQEQTGEGKKKRVVQPPSNETIILPLFRVRELLKHAVSVANEAQALLADEEGEMDVVTAGAVKAWVASKLWIQKVEEVYAQMKRALGQAHLHNPQGMGHETAQAVRQVHGRLFARVLEAEKVPRFNAAAAESVLTATLGKQRASDRPRTGKESWEQILSAAEQEAAQKKAVAEQEAAQKKAVAEQEAAQRKKAAEEVAAAEAAAKPSVPSETGVPPAPSETGVPPAPHANGEGEEKTDKPTSESEAPSTPKADEDETGLGNLFTESGEESRDTEPQSQVTVRNLPPQAKGGGGGNSPQNLLQQTLRRLDPKATVKYETISGPGRFFRSKLTVQWTGPHVASTQAALPVAQRRVPDVVFIDTFSMTGECAESKNQAHDLTATLALNCIEHDRPAQRMLSAGYREWWDEIENCRSRERSRAARQTLARIKELVEPRLVQSPASAAPSAVPAKAKPPADEEQVPLSLESKRPSERTAIRLREALEARQESPAYEAMKVGREQLPIFAYREHILDILDRNQVFVLSGETGCGKSTQVPAYVLEHCLGRGDPCKIYCTEPRRISAISLAERVSAELGEAKNAVGTAESLVGYAIRLESSVGRDARLIYATNGIVLRMLEGDGFKDITHIIIDEVHERSIESDFLLIILKNLMAAKPELKIVLMSATVDAERISAYFGGCPTIAVPGRTFPVQVEHLEDAVELCKYVVEPNSPYERRERRKNGAHTEQKSNLANLKSIEDLDDDDDEGDGDGDGEDEEDAAMLASSSGSGGGRAYSRQTIETIDRMNQNVVNHELIVKLLEQVCFDSPEYERFSKAILVFMPGLADIRALHDVLTAHPRFDQGFRIYPLHSSLSSDSQQHVFDVPPKGTRKIVISTNIAETGVTIPDVTCVIDSGRHREMRFDEKRQISRLVDCFIAQSNAKQRRGRAGRVQEGLCFHLFTKLRYEHHMEEHPLPEMLRLSLQDLALKLKVMRIKIGTSIENALSQALDPPMAVNVQRAVAALVEVKALTTTEEITPLGRHLSKLPLDVHMGKFLLVATTMRCLDAALTITAALNAKSPFVAPLGKEARADAAKQGFKIANSDLLTVANAFNSWKRAVGNHFGRQFCQKNFLSPQTLGEMEELRQQYLLYLIDAGFVAVPGGARKELARVRVRGWGRPRFTAVPAAYSEHGSSASIIHAAAAAGLYPKVIALDTRTNAMRTIGSQQPIAIHPGSVNARRRLGDELPGSVHHLMYFTLLRSRRLYACETAPLDDRALLLMCGEGEPRLGALTLALDKKVRVRLGSLRSLVLLLALRDQLGRLLRTSFRNPGQTWTPRQEWFFALAIRVLGVDAPGDTQLRPA